MKQPHALQLPRTLQNWPGDDCKPALKAEIEQLGADQLPLHLALTEGGKVDERAITATVLKIEDAGSCLTASVGIFFTELIGGCNCADDPIEKNVYCELLLDIDKISADTDITGVGN